MTKEEQIDWLFRLRADLNNGVIFTPWNKEFTEALTDILEQEQCEDEYIKVPKKALKYRTAGMVAYNAEWLKNHFDIERAVICGAQKSKTGHWKFVQRGKYIDICCSKCGFQRVKEYAYNYTVDQISEQDIKDFFANSNMNFCENCGARMNGE